MKIDIKYSGKILNLPSSVAEIAPDASREELLVIIELFSCVEYLGAFDKYVEIFSEKIGIGIERVKRALDFWAEKGVIALDGKQALELFELNRDFISLAIICY